MYLVPSAGPASGDRVARLLGQLELDRPLRRLLHDNRATSDLATLDRVVPVEPYQITAAQLAVAGEVEWCEFPCSMIQLRPNAALRKGASC